MNPKIAKILQILKRDYKTTVKLTEDTKSLKRLLNKVLAKKNSIILEAGYNSYHANKEYSKHLLIESLLKTAIKLQELQQFAVSATGAVVNDVHGMQTRPDLFWKSDQTDPQIINNPDVPLGASALPGTDHTIPLRVHASDIDTKTGGLGVEPAERASMYVSAGANDRYVPNTPNYPIEFIANTDGTLNNGPSTNQWNKNEFPGAEITNAYREMKADQALLNQPIVANALPASVETGRAMMFNDPENDMGKRSPISGNEQMMANNKLVVVNQTDPNMMGLLKQIQAMLSARTLSESKVKKLKILERKINRLIRK
jgi:hypothetical protein